MLRGKRESPCLHALDCVCFLFMLSTEYDCHALIRRPFSFLFLDQFRFISLFALRTNACDEPIAIVVWNRHHVRLLQQQRLTCLLFALVCVSSSAWLGQSRWITGGWVFSPASKRDCKFVVPCCCCKSVSRPTFCIFVPFIHRTSGVWRPLEIPLERSVPFLHGASAHVGDKHKLLM